MGLTFQIAIVPKQSIEHVKSFIQAIPAETKEQWMLTMEKCKWEVQKDAVVFLIDYCAAGEELPAALSEFTQGVVLYIYIYDSDYWGYYLYEKGKLIDYFCSGDMDADGDASILSHYFNVPAQEIENYIKEWDGEAEKPYPDDEHTYNDDWLMLDFMRKLGYHLPGGKQQEPKVEAPAKTAAKKKVKSIPVKEPLIEIMRLRFPAYEYNSSYREVRDHYAFTRKLEQNLYEHIVFWRDFSRDGTGYLGLSSVACCYHANWRTPLLMMGEEHPIESVTTSSLKEDNSGIGYRRYQMQEKNELDQALESLMDDFKKKGMRWLQESRQRMSHKGRWKRITAFLTDAAGQASPEKAEQILIWLKGDISLEPPEKYLEWQEAIKQFPEFKKLRNKIPLEREVFFWIANYYDVNRWS